MPLSVIGAGYPRTGTASLKLALEQLGFGPCHHMREIMMDPASAVLWVQAAAGKPDWEATLGAYRSCTDVPGCTFWRELMEVYPAAKVLLSVRDAEEWFASTQATVFGPMSNNFKTGPLAEFFETAVYKDFGERKNDHDFMLETFRRHNEEVIRDTSRERLLVFDVREGWEPLCAFLGVAAPDTPFPNTNSREEILARRVAAGLGPGEQMDFAKLSATARELFNKQPDGPAGD